MEGLRNVQHTSISSALSLWRLDGSITAGVQGCPWWGTSIKHHPEIKAPQAATTGGATTPSLHSSS